MVKIFDLKSARGLFNFLEKTSIVQRQTNFLFWTYLSIKSHYLELKLSQDVIQSFSA